MSLRIKILHTTEPEFGQWKYYYEELWNKGIYHSPDYIKVLETYYGDEAELLIFGNEQEFMYHPYFKRKLDKLPFSSHKSCNLDLSSYCDIVSSWYYGGPLCSIQNGPKQNELSAKFIEEFHRYCLETNIVSEFIRFDPILDNHLPFIGLIDIQKNRETVCVDLKESEEEIWGNFEGRNRTSIRRAKKSGIKIERSTREKDIIEFSKIYAVEMERKNAPQHYRFHLPFFNKMMSCLDSKISLFLAKIDDKMIGGSLCTHAHGIVNDMLMASLFEYWKYQPNNLILYEAILWSKRNGHNIFDLQGGRDGVFKFKKSFSRTRKNFHTSSIVHNNHIYEKLCKLACEHGMGDSDFFPKYREKTSN